MILEKRELRKNEFQQFQLSATARKIDLFLAKQQRRLQDRYEKAGLANDKDVQRRMLPESMLETLRLALEHQRHVNSRTEMRAPLRSGLNRDKASAMGDKRLTYLLDNDPLLEPEKRLAVLQQWETEHAQKQ